ncbi:MAG: hypothetical protein R3B99_17770 [Polyangiales bacterium]|nr:hypothetical protein [Sandaracinus sp.]
MSLSRFSLVVLVLASSACSFHTTGEARARGELVLGEDVLHDGRTRRDDTTLCSAHREPYVDDFLAGVSTVTDDGRSVRLAVVQGIDGPVMGLELDGVAVEATTNGACEVRVHDVEHVRGNLSVDATCDVIDPATGEPTTFVADLRFHECLRDREVVAYGVVDLAELLVDLARHPEEAARLVLLIALLGAGGGGH